MLTRRAPIVIALLTLLLAACGGGGGASPSAASPIGSDAAGSGVPQASGQPGASGAPSAPLGTPPAATVRPAAAEIAPGVWATTVVESLNLRQAAGTGQPTQGLLPIGSSGLIVAGPQEADGYAWYAFAAPGLPYASGCVAPENVTDLNCPNWFGWVASADPQGNPWVAPAELQCPDAPTTVEAFIGIQPGVRLACFTGVELTLSGYLAPEIPGRECIPTYAVEPAWLDPCAVAYVQAQGSTGALGEPEIAAQLDPALGTCDFAGRAPESCPFVPLLGQNVVVIGHVDDPAAASCTAQPAPGAPVPDPASVVYRCREAFVVTEVRAAG